MLNNFIPFYFFKIFIFFIFRFSSLFKLFFGLFTELQISLKDRPLEKKYYKLGFMYDLFF
jgi:hypothetical protein